uniref:Uncharacterized protein n=1 Tax=Rhizophora mucronata TaxID=61149 RepID=A0A2P2P4I4_RHIMU
MLHGTSNYYYNNDKALISNLIGVCCLNLFLSFHSIVNMQLLHNPNS